MPDEPSRRDTEWFARRLPPADLVTSLVRDGGVARLLGIARDRAVVNTGFDLAPRADAEAGAVEASLRLAMAAAARIARDGDRAPLTAEEEAALDLFLLLVARPAIFVQDGRVTERPENWPEIARDEELLPRILAGVGRIETAAHLKIGSGFLVAPQRILTNNHVLAALFGMHPEDWERSPSDFARQCTEHSRRWGADPGSAPLFELRGELGSAVSSTARLKAVRGHHLAVDMAVVEIDADPAGSRVVPLMSDEPASFAGRRVYAVGYPVDDARDVWGERITPVPVFRRVFGADDESLGTKRFSPGVVLDWHDAHVFTHDASTLPGSSGSCIVDFEQRRVVGLHFRGWFRTHNRAVSLWKFRDDPVLRDNAVVF